MFNKPYKKVFEGQIFAGSVIAALSTAQHLISNLSISS